MGVIFLTVTRPTLVQRNENSLAFVLRAWPSELKELMQVDFSHRAQDSIRFHCVRREINPLTKSLYVGVMVSSPPGHEVPLALAPGGGDREGFS